MAIKKDDNKTLPGYDIEDVNKHNVEEDAWMVVNGYVHDVTSFLGDHPGGKDIMMEYLGKDASSIFANPKVHDHGPVAYNMLTKYRIGVINKCSVVDDSADQKLSKLVDVTKPILPQINGLGENYSPWVHSQIGLKEIIIFDNFLEYFARYPWWYIFMMWPPFMLYALNIAFREAGFLKTPPLFVCGMLSWGIFEYILHRFVFHMQTKTDFWNKFHFFAHGIHHMTPNDSTRLTFPPTFSFVIASIIYQVTTLISAETGIHAYLAGLACGFMLYDAIHFYFHHGDAPWLPSFLKKMKTAHLNHHYKDDTTNFGVTSQIFDYLCGTLRS